MSPHAEATQPNRFIDHIRKPFDWIAEQVGKQCLMVAEKPYDNPSRNRRIGYGVMAVTALTFGAIEAVTYEEVSVPVEAPAYNR